MAPDMKRAILIVGVSCTVLTLWLVPAEPLPIIGADSRSFSESRLTAERRAANAIRDRAGRENALLKRLRLVDSLSARLLSSSTGPVLVDLPPEAGPEELDMLSEAVRRQVEYLGAGADGMIVGVSYVDVQFGNHPDFQNRGRAWADYFSGTVDGRSFCLVAYPFYRSDPTDPRLRESLATVAEKNRSRLSGVIRSLTDITFAGNPDAPPIDVLGPCSFHWAHGSPGPAIRRWLRDDGMSRLARAPWPGGGYRFPPVSEHRGAFGEWNLRNRDFTSVYGRESTVGEGCLAGRIDACRRAVLDPRAYVEPESYPELEEWISSGRSRSGEPFGGRERTWMGDLESEFGRDRFARFWTSDQPVEDAFAAAFGEPIGVWTMRWAQERLGVQKAGPSTDGLSVFLTLATLMACVGIATVTAARRRV